MRKCPKCDKRLFDKGRCYACGFEGLLPPKHHPYKLAGLYCKSIPDFDALLSQHPIIPLWWDTDLDLDEYLELVKKIKANHKAKKPK